MDRGHDGAPHGGARIVLPAERPARPPAAEASAEIRRVDDEKRAMAARRRLRRRGLAAIEADGRIAVLLEPGEAVVAIRRAALLERRDADRSVELGVVGDLYVSTRRLVHLGRTTISYRLLDIRDAVVAGDVLMLILRDGIGLRIGVDDPRLLRVQIAAARSLAGEAGRGGAERSSPAADAPVDPEPQDSRR